MTRYRAFSLILQAKSAQLHMSSVHDRARGRLSAAGNVFTGHGLRIDVHVGVR